MTIVHLGCERTFNQQCLSGYFIYLGGVIKVMKAVKRLLLQVFFKLKLDKGTSYLHSKASLSFYGPFSAKSLNLFSSFVVYERSNSPPLPAVLKSNSPLPGKGRVSNARGMPGGGMLMLQIDRCITWWIGSADVFEANTQCSGMT